MEALNLISVIVMVSAILAEALYSIRKTRKWYSGKDTLLNIGIGISAIFIATSIKVVEFTVYDFSYGYALLKLPSTLIVWILAIVTFDFISYWFHRLGHETRFFWAAHVVHHSSRKYNLSVAVRSPIFNFLWRFLFYIPMALLGFDPLMIITANTIVLFYTFWMHTHANVNNPVFGMVFNTPSHHRVHHAKNQQYLDKNYGSILIIWDRMFGTFEPEVEKPEYGITKDINSYNPLKVLLHEWIDLFRDLGRCRNLIEVFRVLLSSPGNRFVPERNTIVLNPIRYFKYWVMVIAGCMLLLASLRSNGQPGVERLQQLVEQEKFENARLIIDKRGMSSDNPEFNRLAAWIYINLTGQTEDPKAKQKLLERSRQYVSRALIQDDRSAKAHLYMALVHGLNAETESNPRQKLRYVKEIRNHSDKALKLDPGLLEAYYILGRWHLGLSQLNFVERGAVNILFGGMPDGVSIDKAYAYLEHACQQDPACIIFRLGLAQVLMARKNYSAAREQLETILELPSRSVHDNRRKEKARELLGEVT